jgi:soluble lytic murein transglycosylase-like protein
MKNAMAGKRFLFWIFGSVFLIFAISSAEVKISQRLKTGYDTLIKEIAVKHGLDPLLLHAIISAESAYDRFAVSDKGAQGLMQLMPDTAEQYGVQDVFDPEDNIEGGAKYLRDLKKLYGSQTDLILAAYNAGQEAVKKYNSIPPYQETREYVERVKVVYKQVTKSRRTTIYAFVDSRGKLVLTNDFRLAAKSRRP